jgi:class 3 adenylate cyclase/TolB-like protein/Tfp pilus assembly protein PilF
LENQEYKPASLKVSVRKIDSSENSENSSDGGKHKLATIMFSDICGFTKMMGKDEARTMKIVEKNKQIHQKFIRSNDGNLIKEMGDGLLASFESTHDAVRCAKEIMEEVYTEESYHLHISIHLGDIIFTREDIFGDGVNIASRINSCAQKGEIIISEEVWKNIKNQNQFQTDYLGRRVLKNVDHSVRLYKVLLDEEKHKIPFKAILYTHSKTIKLTVLGVIAVAVLLIGYNLFLDSNRFVRDEVKSIAVMAFENRANNPDFDYLSEGLAEDVISELFDLSTVSVISSRSSFRFKNSEKSLRQISRELKADIVLVGNYTISENKVRVKVEFIKGRDNEILNYTSVDSDMNKIKNISQQIGQIIIETLNINKDDRGRKIDDGRKNVNIEAYKYYAMGKSAMHDNTLQKREDITRYFQAAIDIDSTYADPYIGMAEAYIFDVNRGYLSPIECAQKARKYALMAELLKPGSGEVSGIMGILHLLDFEFKQAVPYFEKSIEISPNYDLSYQWYAFTLEALGEFEKAETLLKKVSSLDPLNNFNGFYRMMCFIYQEKYQEAQQVVDEILQVDPDNLQTLFQQAVLYLQLKKYRQAYEALIKRGIGLETNFIAGYTYAMMDMEEEAQVVLDNILNAAQAHYVPPSQLAILYCGLKRYDHALDQIEEAFLVHDPWILWIRNTNFVDPIRDQPRFISLMATINND